MSDQFDYDNMPMGIIGSAGQMRFSTPKEEREKRKSAFLADCAFAKVVETPRGAAIRIGSDIFEVSAPQHKAHSEVVSWLVTALRSYPGAQLSSGSFPDITEGREP